jgi:hypothetical protein
LLKLEISVSKSKIVSPDEQESWDIQGLEDDVILSLKSVLSYKYLGTETTLLMSSTGSKRQQRSITTAKRYKYACFYIGRTGPDVVDATLATWNNIAIPSILSGCEIIPFSETTIEAIERIQAQLAKNVLGLPQSAPNVCALTELGIKPFRLVLWQHQLNFYLRMMNLPKSRWVSMTLGEHLSGDWPSPYIAYITRIRERVKMFQMLPTEQSIRLHMNEWAIKEANEKISGLNLPCLDVITRMERKPYAFENKACSQIAQFRLSCAGLGNKAPVLGTIRWKNCILCGKSLEEMHVAFVCQALEEHRKTNTSIRAFRNLCQLRSISWKESYKKFVNGQDWEGDCIPKKEYIERGLMLESMKREWLRLTGY